MNRDEGSIPFTRFQTTLSSGLLILAEKGSAVRLPRRLPTAAPLQAVLNAQATPRFPALGVPFTPLPPNHGLQTKT